MRSSFEAEIQQLKDDLLVLADMVEQQILNAVDALGAGTSRCPKK